MTGNFDYTKMRKIEETMCTQPEGTRAESETNWREQLMKELESGGIDFKERLKEYEKLLQEEYDLKAPSLNMRLAPMPCSDKYFKPADDTNA